VPQGRLADILRKITASRRGAVISSLMANFIFRYPATSLNVQHQTDDDPDISENEYVGIMCPACTKMHLLNRKTRKLLGQDD
jgi:hypothetical protein